MHKANLTIIIATIPVLLLARYGRDICHSIRRCICKREVFGRQYKSRQTAVSNDCLNPILDSNTIDNAVGVGNCGGTVSQQDESGQASAPITSQTANPAIELQRSTTTTPPPGLGASMTCEECFDILSATQETAIETMLWATFNTQQRGSAGSDIVELIGDIHVCEKTLVDILRCLDGSVG